MTELQEITQDYLITLNGITAYVYQLPGAVLISNNDFSDPDLEYDEIVVPEPTFKTKLRENEGHFII